MLRDALLALLAAALPWAAVVIGARGPLDVTLDLGPNDASYLDGFLPDYEIASDVATRWSTYGAGLTLPLTVSGDATLAWRAARILPETAVVDVSFGGLPVERYTCRGGRFEVRRAALPAAATPARVRFDVDSHDRRGRGLSLDWVRIELAPRGRLRLAGAAAWRPVLLAALFFAAFRFGGFGRRAALLLASPFAGALAAGALRDPFVLAHVTSKLALSTALASVAAAAWLRSRAGGRWVLAIFVAGYVVKGAGLFHPAYFYPDVQLFRRYVFAFAEAEGGLGERGVAAQVATNTAYPRVVAGRAYAFPYSPVYFLPFTLLPRDPALIEDAQRHVALLCASSEALLAFWLAGLVFGAGCGVGAALAAALLPIAYSRLLFAMWPTLAGHVLDTLAIGAALLLLRAYEHARTEPASARWPLLRFAALTQASLLAYVSSLFNLGALLGWVALAGGRRAWRLALVFACAALVAVALLYAPFVGLLWAEILPAVLRGGNASSEATLTGGLLAALARIPLFYGWGWPALAVAGFLLARRRADVSAARVLTAYALAFATLVALRAFGAGLFKDLKEITLVAPLVAVLAGAGLAELWGRGRAARVAVLMLAVGLAAFTAERYAFYWNSYASPVMTPRETGV